MSLSFTANTHQVDHGTGIGVDGASNFTVLMWIYPTTVSAANRQIGGNTCASSSNARLMTGLTSGAGRFRLFLPSSSAVHADAISANDQLVADAWQIIGFRFTTATPELFVGDLTTPIAEVSSYATQNDLGGTANAQVGAFIVGSDPANSFGQPGRIDRIMVWPGTSLTLAQMRAHQFRSAPQIAGCELFTLYGANGTGTQPDWSGNFNAGTVTGASVAQNAPLGPTFGFDASIPFTVAAAGDVAYESQTGALKLAGVNGDVLQEIFYESQAGTLKLAGQTADYLLDLQLDATPGNLPLVGPAADLLLEIFYEATPAPLKLAGIAADYVAAVPGEYEATPGVLKLLGIKSDIILPAVAVGAPSGVKRAYPRRVQISGERYLVRSIEDELRLLRQVRDHEKAKLERPTKTAVEKKAAKVARIRLKRTTKRIAKVEKAQEQADYLRKLDDEIVTIMAGTPWL